MPTIPGSWRVEVVHFNSNQSVTAVRETLTEDEMLEPGVLESKVESAVQQVLAQEAAAAAAAE
jgi:hypothetical protein